MITIGMWADTRNNSRTRAYDWGETINIADKVDAIQGRWNMFHFMRMDGCTRWKKRLAGVSINSEVLSYDLRQLKIW